MSPRLVLAIFLSLAAAAPAAAESFKSWAARGSREEREKDPKAAFGSYSNALSLWKDDDGGMAKAKVLCARAAIQEKDGNDASAMSDYSDCLSLDRKNAKAFHRRGLLHIKANKTSLAISDFYKAIALDIGFGQAYVDRAGAYEGQGEKGFAYEDYRHACELGIKSACPKAKALASKTGAKSKSQSKSPTPETAEEEAPSAEPSAKTGKPAKSTSYYPKYRDCLAALNACVEDGNSFGSCVQKAPNCDQRAVKGCCPTACLKTYQKAINRGLSEAEAFRDHFAPDAACGIPPKAEEED